MFKGDDRALSPRGRWYLLRDWMRIVLLRASWITGIEPLEQCQTTLFFDLALGALPAGRFAVAVVRTCRRERASASGAQDAVRTGFFGFQNQPLITSPACSKRICRRLA